MNLPGTVNSSLMQYFIRQQTYKWEGIALKVIDDVNKAVARFNTEVLNSLLNDEAMRKHLREAIVRKSSHATTDAKLRVRQLVQDEQSLIATTQPSFEKKLQQARAYRATITAEKLNRMFGRDQIDIAEAMPILNKSTDDRVVEDTHDILKAYYEVALDRFIDNVWNQAIKKYVLGPDGPSRVFSPQHVGGLKGAMEEEIAVLAGHTDAHQSRRKGLELRLRDLQDAAEEADEIVDVEENLGDLSNSRCMQQE